MLRDDYKVARNNVKKLMRQTKRAYEKKIALGSKENPKAFWAHVRQKLKTKPGVAPLLSDNLDPDSTKFNDKEKAEILQNQFSSFLPKSHWIMFPLSRKNWCNYKLPDPQYYAN